SGPTCSTLLYARLRASSDIVIQSMVGHSFAPSVVGVAMPATVTAIKGATIKHRHLNLTDQGLVSQTNTLRRSDVGLPISALGHKRTLLIVFGCPLCAKTGLMH